MKTRLLALLCTTSLLLNGCVKSPIDAPKKGVTRTEKNNNNTPTAQLTDKDIFGEGAWLRGY